MNAHKTLQPGRVLSSLASVFFISFLGSTAANAAPVDVSYQLSGTAGHWVLDFSVSNNMPSTGNQMVVYLFGVDITGSGHLNSPSDNWPIFFQAMPTDVLNGSGRTYGTNWVDDNYGTAIGYGQTLSGFQVSDPDLNVPTGVHWLAYGVGNTGPNVNIVYTGSPSDYIGPVAYNPGFEGVAYAVNSVPVPSAIWLFGTGVLGLIGAGRNRKAL
jgi:hypothetical protein